MSDSGTDLLDMPPTAPVAIGPGAVSNTDEHPDPFNRNCVRIEVTRPIEVSQLAVEIEARTKYAVQVVLSAKGQTPSAGAPAVLFVSPKSVNVKVIQAVIDQHVPAPSAPLEETVQDPSLPSVAVPEHLQPLVDKLAAGESLEGAETSDLLRAILGITPKA